LIRFKIASWTRGAPRTRAAALPRAAAALCLSATAAIVFPAAAVAAVVPWISLEEMTRAAQVIVLGSVESVEGAWSEDGRIIVSRVTITVERSLKGGPRRSVSFDVPGGKVGEQIMLASGAPVFARGERVIVFLEARGDGGGQAATPGPLSVAGWSQGKLVVRRDRSSGRDLVHGRTAGTAYLDRQGKPVDAKILDAGPVELAQFLATVEDLIGGGKAGARP
jgi:hypothetical protein